MKLLSVIDEEFRLLVMLALGADVVKAGSAEDVPFKLYTGPALIGPLLVVVLLMSVGRTLIPVPVINGVVLLALKIGPALIG